MQCISSLILTLAASATLVMAVPAPAPMPAPTAAAVLPEAQPTAAPVLNLRGATVDSFPAKCTVGSDSVATCTGAVHATNVWAGVIDATVDSSTS
ncbi:hypothetical protein KVR01_001015 [Diaporthe batatas]|uniref:uncharacterized protein n=1 Tax=Diaporthe batatas TaxID=748121 RepID=UPI001D0396BC|nr:uncharacterized protein KVR01_001015 [Diaporthe batatas]KAG8170270.1 hypothetical protein KVR01_001015 [Diaporthe batatas]